MAFFREIPDKKLSDIRKLLVYNAFRRQEIVVNQPRLFILTRHSRNQKVESFFLRHNTMAFNM